MHLFTKIGGIPNVYRNTRARNFNAPRLPYSLIGSYPRIKWPANHRAFYPRGSGDAAGSGRSRSNIAKCKVGIRARRSRRSRFRRCLRMPALPGANVCASAAGGPSPDHRSGRSRPLLQAHVGMMLALHGVKPPQSNPSKEWGRRKLKRVE
jgi:hypothetical protein